MSTVKHTDNLAHPSQTLFFAEQKLTAPCGVGTEGVSGAPRSEVNQIWKLLLLVMMTGHPKLKLSFSRSITSTTQHINVKFPKAKKF